MTKGVLLVGHGSRLPYNKMMLDFHADLLTKKGFANVYVSFNEMTDPGVESALDEMIEAGVDDIVALPVFAASGRHTESDIPEKLGLPDGYGTGTSSKGVKIRYEKPFGESNVLIDILTKKIEDAAYSDGDAVLLIAHGSPRSSNSELVRSLSDRIASRYRNTFYAFNEYNEPTIEDEFAKILAGGFPKIVVVPVFMASGAHLGEEIPNKLAIPPGSGGSVIDHEGHPVRICYQEPFGMDPRLNDILAAKISGPAN